MTLHYFSTLLRTTQLLGRIIYDRNLR